MHKPRDPLPHVSENAPQHIQGLFEAPPLETDGSGISTDVRLSHISL